MAAYPKQVSFTVTFSKTLIYIISAIALFLMSFIIAANAQTQYITTNGTTYGTISSGTTTCCITSTPPQYITTVQKEPIKENQHLWVWKWIAMLATFGGGIIFSAAAFTTFNNK